MGLFFKTFNILETKCKNAQLVTTLSNDHNKICMTSFNYVHRSDLSVQSM